MDNDGNVEQAVIHNELLANIVDQYDSKSRECVPSTSNLPEDDPDYAPSDLLTYKTSKMRMMLRFHFRKLKMTMGRV